MIDPRVTKLANTLVNYSCAVKPGEKILIEAIDVPTEFTTECVRLASKAGAMPLVLLNVAVTLVSLGVSYWLYLRRDIPAVS